MISTTLFSSSLVHSLPHWSCYWWFFVGYLFILIILLFNSVISSSSLLNISSIISICASILGSSLLSLLWIHFQINCPSLVHLVVVLEFYLFLHLGNILLLSCFCLTFCICGLFSAGYRIMVLASGVCSLVGEFGPGACSDFLVEGSGPAHC